MRQQLTTCSYYLHVWGVDSLFHVRLSGSSWLVALCFLVVGVCCGDLTPKPALFQQKPGVSVNSHFLKSQVWVKLIVLCRQPPQCFLCLIAADQRNVCRIIRATAHVISPWPSSNRCWAPPHQRRRCDVPPAWTVCCSYATPCAFANSRTLLGNGSAQLRRLLSQVRVSAALSIRRVVRIFNRGGNNNQGGGGNNNQAGAGVTTTRGGGRR